jgi:hypothetical protein
MKSPTVEMSTLLMKIKTTLILRFFGIFSNSPTVHL